MRISEIKGEAVIDVIADIIEPVANIATDTELQELFEKQTVENKEEARTVAIERLKKHVPQIIKNHKRDVITILAIVNGEDVEDYEQTLTLRKLFVDVAVLLGDDEFVDFFTSAVSTNDTDSTSTSTIGEPPLSLA